MKKLKLLALLLAVVCLFVACAGSSDSDDGKDKSEPKAENIVGTWAAECDLSAMMAEQLSEEFDVDAPFVVTLALQMNEDGTMSMSIDEEASKESVETYLSAMLDVMLEATYVQAEAEGMTREEFDQQMESSLGMSYKEYMESTITADMLLESMVSGMEEATGTYQYEDGKLLVAEDGEELTGDQYWTVTLDGDKMTVTEIHESDADETLEELLPLEFVRK